MKTKTDWHYTLILTTDEFSLISDFLDEIVYGENPPDITVGGIDGGRYIISTIDLFEKLKEKLEKSFLSTLDKMDKLIKGSK